VRKGERERERMRERERERERECEKRRESVRERKKENLRMEEGGRAHCELGLTGNSKEMRLSHCDIKNFGFILEFVFI